MKFTVLRSNPLIGKVWNDTKSVCYGIYGQVGALLDEGVLLDAGSGREMWIFIPADAPEFGRCVPQPSRESLKAYLWFCLLELGG